MVINFLKTARDTRTQTMFCDYCGAFQEATHKEDRDHGRVLKSWWVCNNCFHDIGTTRQQLRKDLILAWSIGFALLVGGYYWIYSLLD